MKLRFRVIISLVAVSFVVAGWWTFHFPFRPELVYRVIPENATAASRHICPARRINMLCESSVITNIASAIGTDGDALVDALDDYGTKKLISIIGDKQVVSALVPSIGGYGQSGYIFGAWIGGYSQILRWGLLDHFLTDFRVHRLKSGRRVWVSDCSQIKEGYFLSLAVHEGVLVGCLSSEQFGVVHLIPRLIEQRPVAVIAEDWCNSEGIADEFKATVLLPRKIGRGELILHGSFPDISEKRILAEVYIAPDNDANTIWNKYFPKESLEVHDGSCSPIDVLGEAPGALTSMPVLSVSPFLDLLKIDEHGLWKKMVGLFNKESNAYLFACGDEFYGHIMLMKVPAFGMMIPLASDINEDVVVSRVVDELNATWGWGLIATPDSQDKRIKVINTVRGGDFKNLRPNERPAIAICDGWLIALSNVDVLRHILRNSGKEESELLQTVAESSIYGWSDLEETGDMLKTALYGYTLVSVLQRKKKSTRYDTREVKMAIRVLGKLGESAVWLNTDCVNPKLNMELMF